MRNRLLLAFLTATLCVLSLAPPLPAAAQTDDGIPWDAWTKKDVASIGDDNTGSAVALSEAVITPSGAPTLEITPGGEAEETKIALPFRGEALADLAKYRTLTFDVYLPEANVLNPSRFFLGLADMTGGFSWVGGIFSETEAQPGWNQVIFRLDAAMQQPVAGRTYMLFLSFYNDDSGVKTPLREPFYLGDAILSEPVSDAESGMYRAEVDALLAMTDEAMLDAVARKTFDFFWLEANPDNGLIKDRSTPGSPSSIASVGFGLAAIPIAIERGWIARDAGYQRTLTTLDSFLNGGVQGEHGFFYHFVNMRTGRRAGGSELSSIDTALLVAGALVAGQYFAGTQVADKAQQLYENVDWQWMTADGNFPRMGWTPERGFIDAAWDHFDESLILYALAIGSPTHPIPAEAWQYWRRPVDVEGEYIHLPDDVLFVYQYPLAFLNLRGKEDAYANYWNNTARACQRNRQYAIEHAERFPTYRDGVWGISASDGPRGYRAYGARDGKHDGTVAPYASVACLPFTPDIAMESLRAMLRKYGEKVWGKYGLVSAINEDRNWYSTQHIGIDQGDILLMIANAQDGLVWDLFTQHPAIQKALDAMGFVESTGDYAVTPAYLAQVRGR